MVQQPYVRMENNTKQLKTPWISLVLSLVFVSLPPLAVWAMGRHEFDTRGHPIPLPDPLLAFLEKSGAVFAGLFLFPFLSFGALVLAFISGLRGTVTKPAKITLWMLFTLSVLNCGLVISFFSTHINK
jgi:hypothetical protein